MRAAQNLGRFKFRLEIESRYSLEQVVSSLLSLEWGGTWDLRKWSIWAVFPDGTRFLLRSFYDEPAAQQALQAYLGQIRGEPVAGWARRKGFTELAQHLDEHNK